MGLLSKLRRGRGKVKFSDNFFYNPRRAKLRAFFDKKIQADLARAQKNPLGLGALLPSVENKVPLAPVFAGMPIPQMVAEPQMLPQSISRVPVKENISQISTPGFGMRDMQMNMMEPRMMMAEGDVALSEEAATDSLIDFLNSDPEQVAFGRQVGESLAYDDGVIQITEKELDDYSKNYLARNREMATALGLTVDDIRAQSLEAIRRKKEGPLLEGGKYNPFENPRRVPEFATGDEVKPDFLDFDNDGDKEESMKQALQQKNKMAEGDEVSMMMMEMDQPAEMPKEGMEDVDMLMDEVADVAPAAQMLDQYVNMVVEMIQAGASEEEIIQMLVEAGLDEEDINAVFQAVIEALEGPSIDSELAALG